MFGQCAEALGALVKSCPSGGISQAQHPVQNSLGGYYRGRGVWRRFSGPLTASIPPAETPPAAPRAPATAPPPARRSPADKPRWDCPPRSAPATGKKSPHEMPHARQRRILHQPMEHAPGNARSAVVHHRQIIRAERLFPPGQRQPATDVVGRNGAGDQLVAHVFVNRETLRVAGSAALRRQAHPGTFRALAGQQFPPAAVQVVAQHPQTHITQIAGQPHVPTPVQAVMFQAVDLAFHRAVLVASQWRNDSGGKLAV